MAILLDTAQSFFIVMTNPQLDHLPRSYAIELSIISMASNVLIDRQHLVTLSVFIAVEWLPVIHTIGALIHLPNENNIF